MAEHFGHRAGLRNRLAKRIVCVFGDDVACRVGVAEDVAVCVGVGNVDRAVAPNVEQTSDTASALQSAREILAPAVMVRRICTIRVGVRGGEVASEKLTKARHVPPRQTATWCNATMLLRVHPHVRIIPHILSRLG